MAITRLVKLTLTEDKADVFEAYFKEINTQILKQNGCLDVKLLKDIRSKGVFFTYSEWESESHLNAYRDSELFNQVWPKVKQWFAGKPEAWSFLPILT